MTEVLDSLNKIDNLPPDHVSKTKTKEWILTLNGMKAFEELDEDQARQMSFDLDVAYQAYHQFVQSKGK